MSKELEKMNIISIVQKLKEDDVIILQKYIENLEKENEKLNHYKTLYQSLKRQKDIEIEQLESSIGIIKHNMIIQKHVDRERKLQKKIEAIEKAKEEAVEFIINNISKTTNDYINGDDIEFKELYSKNNELLELLKILRGVNDEK